MKIKSKILIIAGSDSSGGAGIQADIKTVTSLGSYAMTAITAITSQNTTGVKSIVPVNSREISKQIEFTAKDIKPDAVKIGMLHSKDVINSVIKSLKIIKVKKIILDPVMVAKGGKKLISDSAIKILKNKFLSKVDLITPNIPEAEILTNSKIITIEDVISAGNNLLQLGAKNILIKGGHLKSKKIQDVFINNQEMVIFNNKKIKTKNSHGTGCTLSSAIATYFACGKTLKKSCEMAIKYVNHSLRTQPNLGKGHGPVNHLNSIKIRKMFR
ncbi:bifunctional hydroxymethylpyrimidine kinase/phosphomethylpyrimidine kinase [Pelagibacterales bacterium SAG-MED17]|nr:bifunctional hydroxymethylpyrimidine kinase/phosphomethylpyrimidine kinase [Pelagibacterales bacterium SAG-MED17]